MHSLTDCSAVGSHHHKRQRQIYDAHAIAYHIAYIVHSALFLPHAVSYLHILHLALLSPCRRRGLSRSRQRSILCHRLLIRIPNAIIKLALR